MSASTRTGLLLFAVAWGTNHFVPLLVVYRAELRLSAVALAILFGVYAVGLVPGLLVGGPLSDRVGRRAVVLPASTLALAGTAILAFGAAGFPVLLLGRFVVGVGSGATFSAGTAWLQDLSAGFPSGTGARRASIALSSGFGGGPFVTGLVAQWAPRPMVTPYGVQGLLLLSAIATAWAATAPAAPRSAPSPATRRTRAALPAGFMATVGPVAPWVFAFPSIAFAVLPALVGGGFRKFAVAYAGTVAAITLLSGVLIQPLMKTWSPRNAATVALLVGAAGLLGGLAALSFEQPWGVLAPAPLLGTGYGGCLISGLRTIESTTTPESRGHVIGIFYVLTYTGFVAPFVLAKAAEPIGYGAGLAVTAALATLTAAWSGRPISATASPPRQSRERSS